VEAPSLAEHYIRSQHASAGFGIMSLCIPGGPKRFSIEALRLRIAALTQR
jgi:hypothetical protein